MTDQRPPGWGEDELGQFLLTAERNMVATFVHMRPLYDRLAQIDRLYRYLVPAASESPSWFVGFFLLRAHGAFLGSCRCSLSGQLPETFMLLRGCLESSLYGLYLSLNPSSAETWLKRHDEDDAARDQVRREFTVGNMFICLNSIDVPLRDRAKRLYDLTIDYGAHPNERAFTSNLLRRHGETGTEFTMLYLNTVPPALLFGLSEATRVGLCALEILGKVFPEIYSNVCAPVVEAIKMRLKEPVDG